MDKVFQQFEFKQLKRHKLWIAALCALLLHLFFFFVLAPLLTFQTSVPGPTEVVEINASELAKIKKRIQTNPDLVPLLPHEQHQKFKTKEAPKEAQMIGAFNQTVPKQMTAGAQEKVFQEGDAQIEGKPKSNSTGKKMELSSLGLGNKLVAKLDQNLSEKNESSKPEGGKVFRPVGRDDKTLERGNQNLLNAVENEYYSFFVRFEEPIVRNWYFLLSRFEREIRQEIISKQLKAGTELPITVEFVLDKQGNFRSVDLVEASKLPTLDRCTLNAVKKLGALPNPPIGIFKGQSYFTYRLRFVVHITEAVSRSSPDLQWY